MLAIEERCWTSSTHCCTLLFTNSRTNASVPRAAPRCDFPSVVILTFVFSKYLHYRGTSSLAGPDVPGAGGVGQGSAVT